MVVVPASMRWRLLLAAACLVTGMDVRAAEWFVAPTGSDATGTGAITAPFRTITHVLDPANGIVEAGDIVTLRGPPGHVYAECDVRLRVPLTLRSAPGERAHIHCNIAVEDSVAVQIDPSASGSRLSRLEISGGFYYAVFLQTDWEQGGDPSATGASDIVIEDSFLHDSGRDVVKITPKSDDVTIRRCEIARSGAGYPPGTPTAEKNAEGIDNVNGARMIVEDSYVHDTATTGIYFKGGATDVVVQRNVVERTGEAGILAGFDTSPEFFDLNANPQYHEAIRGIVRNNIVRDTAMAGIGLYASRDTLVANNTIVRAAEDGQAALYFGVTLQDFDPDAGRPPNVGARLVNNLVRAPRGDCIGIRWADEIEPEGLFGLVGDPDSDHNAFDTAGPACTFRDTRPGSALSGGGTLAQWRAAVHADGASIAGVIAVDGDDRLVAGSLVIDAGATVATITDDIDRDARIAPYDIGADERDAGAIFRHGFED